MYLVPVKSTMDILQNSLAFSEYMNFKQLVEVLGLEIDRLKNFKFFDKRQKKIMGPLVF